MTREQLQQVRDALDSKYIANSGAWVCQRNAALAIIEAELAKPEQPSFAEWSSDYVRDNLHKLKAAQPERDALKQTNADQLREAYRQGLEDAAAAMESVTKDAVFNGTWAAAGIRALKDGEK